MNISCAIITKRRNRPERRARPGRGNKFVAASMFSWRRMPLIFCLILALVLFPKIAVAQGDSVSEYDLKAAMLYNLTRFVEWPPSAYAGPQAPTVLCILGRDPFGGSLTSIVAAESSRGRPVQIRHLQNNKGIRSCHVLYIGSSEKKNLVQIISLLKRSSVLTVGEMAQFAARGGMIQFSLVDRQVRFDINLEAASQADLRISSRLLVLARIVTGKSNDSGAGSWAFRSEPFECASLMPRATHGKLQGNGEKTRVTGKESGERRWSI